MKTSSPSSADILPVLTPDFSKLQASCADYVEKVLADEYIDEDTFNYMFEEAMFACYGPDIFRKLNGSL